MSEYSTATVYLIYRDTDGHLHQQNAFDLVSSGTLVDPISDRDMPVIGWTTDEYPNETVLTSEMNLVYQDENGGLHCQQWNDVVSYGTLVSSITGDDMPLVGWLK